MKQLKDILQEKLIVHKDMGYVNNNDLDELLGIDKDGYTKIGHKRAKNKNGYIFWALAWEYLFHHGPMRKVDLMQAMNDEGLTIAKPTSSAVTFATLNRQGIICGVKGKLEARPPEEWKI
jgi:hypothetical protein